jgi:hypothetical protein
MRRKRDRQTWESEAFINRVFTLMPDDQPRYREIQSEIMQMHRASSKMGSVALHKDRLGDQDYTWVGEFRFWVWETADWRVYANNHKGTCFEIRADLTDEEAFAAWKDYLARLDLANVNFSREEIDFFESMKSPIAEVRF